MGDWRKPRVGLTKRERGIPLDIFRKIITNSGFRIINEKKCMFPLTKWCKYLIKKPIYNSQLALFVDNILCTLFVWNYKYHAVNVFDKLRPTSIFYVLKKH